jgi:predicted transcriptional regulator of viral defense system
VKRCLPRPGTLIRYVLDLVLASPVCIWCHEIAESLREDRHVVSKCLCMLTDRDLVVRLGPGAYVSPTVAASLVGQPPPKAWRGGMRSTSIPSRVLRFVGDRDVTSVEDVANELDISPMRASGHLCDLVAKGKIARVRRGVYATRRDAA